MENDSGIKQRCQMQIYEKGNYVRIVDHQLNVSWKHTFEGGSSNSIGIEGGSFKVRADSSVS